MGGLARKEQAVKTLRRESNHPIVLVDCGNVFINDPIKADILAESMDRMGYAVLNIGHDDFLRGLAFLNELKSRVSFSLISSNLKERAGDKPFFKPYAIIEEGGLRIALVGVMPQNAFEGLPFSKIGQKLVITDPAKALKRLVPALRKKSDRVVLLSQLGKEDTGKLLEEINGIGNAIYCHRDKGKKKASAKDGLFWGGDYASLGALTFSVQGKDRLQASNQMIKLDKRVPGDYSFASVEKRYKMERKIKKEAEELMKLTPQQYMEKLLNEQKEQERHRN